ncbi:MAG: glycosyltransferase family 39 protein [Candidatus Hydrogenedentes bacterium]|nr:glycosyltransferase family 39 protein [Candidatus Hydrogenedentota bacterium]
MISLNSERRAVLALFVAALAALAAMFARELRKPETVYLADAGGAQWIGRDHPFSLLSWGDESRTVFFRTAVAPEAASAGFMIEVMALRRAAVYWNGALVHDTGADLGAWKRARTVALPALAPGLPPTLQVAAMNHNGPVLIRVASDAIAPSSPAWECSLDGDGWRPAVVAGHRAALPLQRAYPDPIAALLGRLPWLLLAGTACAALSFYRARIGGMLDAVLTPGGLRWGVIAYWVALGANNMFKIRPEVGMDALPHLEYIAYVAQAGRIPLATEGWQMFQSPLYYVISAPMFLVAAAVTDTDTVMQALRVAPLLCGALQTEVAYRTARLVAPEKAVAQAAGTLLGGLLPMHVYLSQVVGNEPLCSLLSSVTVYLVFRGLRAPAPEVMGLRGAALLGVCLGLAMLSKASALLLAPLAIAGVLWPALLRGAWKDRGAWGAAAVTGGVAAVLAGPYYVRNWILLGKPFLGGWDPERAIVWWQDPGYRTAGDFFSFGMALTQPIYAATYGLWDSIYSTLWLDGSLSGTASVESAPGWNPEWLMATALLGLIPTAGLIAGAVGGVASRDAGVFRISAGSLGAVLIYTAALAHHFLAAPFYSSGKASYLGGITPALVALLCCGVAALAQRRWSAAIAAGLAGAWALGVMASYWVL